jgi:hypothetical protein
MHATYADPWIGDWVWALPLIVLTVVFHVCGLAFIGEGAVYRMSGSLEHRGFLPKFALIMGGTSLLVTLLHGAEAAMWAFTFRFLGALPDQKTAMLYSLSAITSYGHANLFLKDRWQLLGALEALNGMLLFGLTTAFLFAMIQRAWPLGSRNQRHEH